MKNTSLNILIAIIPKNKHMVLITSESVILLFKNSFWEYILLPVKYTEACPIPRLPIVTNNEGISIAIEYTPNRSGPKDRAIITDAAMPKPSLSDLDANVIKTSSENFPISFLVKSQ